MTIEIDERVYNELKKEITFQNERFQKIDLAMSKIEVGTIVYEDDPQSYRSYFPKKVIEVIDKDLGIIRTLEESINRTEEKNVLSYYTEDQIKGEHK